jgi:hypothetical protein
MSAVTFRAPVVMPLRAKSVARSKRTSFIVRLRRLRCPLESDWLPPGPRTGPAPRPSSNQLRTHPHLIPTRAPAAQLSLTVRGLGIQRSMRFSDACMDVLAGDSHGCGYGCWRTRFPPSQGEEVSAPPSPMRNAQRLRRATISRRTKPRSIPSQHLMATADE